MSEMRAWRRKLLLGSVGCVLLWVWLKRRGRLDRGELATGKIASGRGAKTMANMPSAGWWYLYQLVVDNKGANRKLYNAYGHLGVIKLRGISLSEEVVIFDMHDVIHAHKNEGLSPGGAGDILFSRMTQYFTEKFGPTSHGSNLYGKGLHHNNTRDMVMGGKMRATEAVISSARRVVADLSHWAPNNVDIWCKYAAIDMFFAVMTGRPPNLTNPVSNHELKKLPDDDEKGFMFGLLLSVLPKILFGSMESE